MSLKPGIAIEIEYDLPSGRQRRLRSILYDGDGSRLIISQTTPPLLTSSKGQSLQVSYIAKKNDVLHRFGFSATIIGFMKDYELSHGTSVPTLVLSMTSKPKEVNARQAFRICPTGNSGLSLSIVGENCTICDVSLTGVSYVQRSSRHAFSPNDRVEGALSIDGKRYPLKAKVVRVQEKKDARFTALFFTEMEQALHDALNKRILMLQRKELKRWF